MSWLFPLPRIDHDRILAAIRRAELKSSGNIRVLIARHKAADPVAAARRHFEKLGMTLSPHRNGVLIFLAPRTRSFAVIGDTAVHQKCGDPFWTGLAAAMTGYFKRGEFTEGLVHGIDRAGALLAEHFPPEAGARPAQPGDVANVD